jgi:uncharacterized protein HemY
MLREQLPRTSSPTRLQRFAQLAEGTGDTELEWHVLDKLVAAGEDGPKLQRRLGTLAFQRHNMKVAEQHLSRFVADIGGDYETLMLLGNIAMRKRDTGAAQAWFTKGLQKLQQSGDQSFRARTVEANLMHRLGQDVGVDGPTASRAKVGRHCTTSGAVRHGDYPHCRRHV